DRRGRARHEGTRKYQLRSSVHSRIDEGTFGVTVPRERLRRLALVLASVLLTLLAVEMGLRASGVAPLPETKAGGFRPEHPLLRMLHPSECKPFGTREGAYFVNVCTNKMGLRDRDHDAAEAPRVLGLGDSFTFGWGVESSDTFLAHLERALRLAM